MFSSRNIHFAILGIILGASTGYIFAFYQAARTTAQQTAPAANSGAPQNHPNVGTGQILEMFKVALEKNPNEPELLMRYGIFLSNLGRFAESAEWFQKSVAIRPNHMPTLENLFDVQLEGLRDVKAAEATLKKMQQTDPNYAALPALRKRLDQKEAAK